MIIIDEFWQANQKWFPFLHSDNLIKVILLVL